MVTAKCMAILRRVCVYCSFDPTYSPLPSVFLHFTMWEEYGTRTTTALIQLLLTGIQMPGTGVQAAASGLRPSTLQCFRLKPRALRRARLDISGSDSSFEYQGPISSSHRAMVPAPFKDNFRYLAKNLKRQ